MTDSNPDDKNLGDEAATTEEIVQDAAAEAVDAATAAEDEADAPTETVSTAKKADVVGSAVKKRPASPVDEDDDEAETAPVRRSRPAPRAAAARQGAGLAAGATVMTVVATVVVIALLAGTIVFGLLWNSKRGELNDLKTAAADRAQAEKVASDYAAGASTFDFHDLGPWRTALTKGVSPELKTKLEATVGAMNQLLQPLQWVSKGTVLDAVVNSESGPVYKVSAYVKVEATNVQAASGREVITVYNVTLDKSKDWQVTDVGGVGGGVPASAAAESADPTPGTPTTPGAAPAATPAPGN
ncbi:hypothetical protein [Tsukamurella pseudospumae]|uniref:Mce-associated membrane protein n=1 Tax=Tsukamurella pseudospumae TaxID=239498 RepID=A0A137YSI0_9ACTN|nr:hypothetical protein [Tsukamurella pseudospumae]KXO88821.1 hypothetical protein AXK61_09190 [Tsukamurella pseudospumae]